MKTYSIVALFGALAFIANAEDGFLTDFSSGWRFTAGPQFNFNAKGKLGVRNGAIPVPRSSSSSTRGSAQASGDGIGSGTGRITFPNGGFIDPNDSAGVAGETWNWRIPAGQLDNGTMSFASSYTEQSTTYTPLTGGSGKDDADSVGANLGLDRTVWKWGDFGMDLGFNFSFFIKDNWFKGRSGGYTRTDTYTEGTYNTDVSLGNAVVFNDSWAQNPDGSYGAGTFDGPGPVINIDEIYVVHSWGTERTTSSTSAYGPLSIRGDLQMYEFQQSLKPYYELTEWFMVRGMVGVGVDYRNLDVRVSEVGRSSERDWDCYMICGLGGMFHWKGVCLGADFLRKVFDDEMDVNTRYVNGSIENSEWMLRVYVGYEF